MTKAAIVTGAARGIGASTVLALAGAGWSVIALDRCSDDPRLRYALGTRVELDALVERARAVSGGRGEVVGTVGDASRVEVVSDAVDRAERHFGGLDAYIAAAGVIAGGVPQWELDPAAEAAVLEANLSAVLVASRVAIPALLRRPTPRDGRFIAVASAAGSRGLPLLAAYCAAKAGVIARGHRCHGEYREPWVDRHPDPR
jgi:NAD(P)-dependent dehydrogenase (short-subunit alcohol dehydrogenase family)